MQAHVLDATRLNDIGTPEQVIQSRSVTVRNQVMQEMGGAQECWLDCTTNVSDKNGLGLGTHMRNCCKMSRFWQNKSVIALRRNPNVQLLRIDDRMVLRVNGVHRFLTCFYARKSICA